jgi:Holliday junction resolvase RusA-like endonuclease
MIYEIRGELATLNEHDGANRSNKFKGAALKKEMTEIVRLQMLNKPKINKPSIITFNWFYSSKCDFDNIRFGAKYILDGIVKAGVMPDDNQNWVKGFGGDYFTKCNKGEEKVIVEIEEFD